VAVNAERSVILGHGVPANAALAGGVVLQNAGRRLERSVAPGGGPLRRAECTGHRYPDAALDTRERRSCPLRRWETRKRKKGSKIHMAVDTCWRSMSHRLSRRQRQKTAAKWSGSRVPCRSPPMIPSNLLGSTRAPLSGVPPMLLPGMVVRSRLSNCWGPYAASSSCHYAGSSNDHSHRQPVSAASSKSTSAMPKSPGTSCPPLRLPHDERGR
jgi:hypothetical protein